MVQSNLLHKLLGQQAREGNGSVLAQIREVLLIDLTFSLVPWQRHHSVCGCLSQKKVTLQNMVILEQFWALLGFFHFNLLNSVKWR